MASSGIGVVGQPYLGFSRRIAHASPFAQTFRGRAADRPKAAGRGGGTAELLVSQFRRSYANLTIDADAELGLTPVRP